MVGRLCQQKLKSGSGAYDGSGISNNGRNKNFVSSMYSQARKDYSQWKLYCIFLCIILMLLFLIVFLPVLDQMYFRTQFFLKRRYSVCEDKCRFEFVESIPEGLIFPNSSIKHKSTFETWKKLIQMAEHNIEIASFYWTLKKWEEFPVESKQGDEIFNDLLNAGIKRNITIRIAQNKPSASMSKNDTEILIMKKAAQVKSLDFDALLGTGVLHTKFWIVDRKHLYIGSANMDWRALNQVKELGIALYNCSCVAEDLAKIFEVYWALGNQTVLPSKWPESLSTIYNSNNPFKLNFSGQKSLAYISSAPPQFSPKGRTEDIDGLLQIIRDAKQYIHISVMNYLPLVLFTKKLEYWSAIDDELRKAVVERHVKVRIMTSQWPSSRPMEVNFLKSLLALNKFRKDAVVEVKFFKVPSNPSQSKIPYARVNHNKYMVTDNGAFIGTSNWSGDYFKWTAGISFISPSINGTENVIQKELQAIFDRDWNSPYASSLYSDLEDDALVHEFL